MESTDKTQVRDLPGAPISDNIGATVRATSNSFVSITGTAISDNFAPGSSGGISGNGGGPCAWNQRQPPVDNAAKFTYFVNWGDGSDPDDDGVIGETVTGANLVDVPHAFERKGTYVVSITATDKDGGTAIHDALYRAYFVDGWNIAQIDNLLSVVRQLGLPEDEARQALASRRFWAAVDADWQRCRDFGITAVPTFIVGNRGVVGAQSYEVLETLVVNGGAARR